MPALLEIDGETLTVDDVIAVGYSLRTVVLSNRRDVVRKMQESERVISAAIRASKPIYGVTTNFGGLAKTSLPLDVIAGLQNNLLWGLKCGAGRRLPDSHIRSGMLIRANALMKGASGIRLELIERIVKFLNGKMTPVVREYGSIGASGDLIPLTYVAGAVVGLDDCFRVSYKDQEISSLEALKRLGLEPIALRPKEGLSLINGTSMMTGIATHCLRDAERLLRLCLYLHAYYLLSLRGSLDPFHPFVHDQKPYPGQKWVAQFLRRLLSDCPLMRHPSAVPAEKSKPLMQDRYSLRCLPQYLGPLVDGMAALRGQIEIEINAASDNPLINADADEWYHSGNFLGEYIGVGMDQLRSYLALLIKHVDVQIALLVCPEFNDGLPPSLIAGTDSQTNIGLKGAQICGNSIMPLVLHLANPISTLYPTHAEQYNQNINSLGFSSAQLAVQSIDLVKHHLSIAVLFAIQAIALRAHATQGTHDPRRFLSAPLVRMLEAIHAVVGRPITADRAPIHFNLGTQLDGLIHEIKHNLDQQDSPILQICSEE